MRGEGVRMGCRCFWDADTDNYADESYRNVRGCRSRAARAASARPPHASACPGAAGAPLTDALFRARRTRSFASRPPSGCTCTKRNSHARHRISRQSLPFSASLICPRPGATQLSFLRLGTVFPIHAHAVRLQLSSCQEQNRTNTLCTHKLRTSSGPVVRRVRRRCQSGKAAGRGCDVECS